MRADVDSCGDSVPHLVEQFADDRLLFLGERFHLLAPGRNGAAAAEIFQPGSFERPLVARGFDLAQGVVAQLFQRMHKTLKR